ncbi:MAG: PD40 domain-containing protein [Chloroflexi bacterium]|nr:PD40 domain-containing protein [Chloroflexota bacterium]
MTTFDRFDPFERRITEAIDEIAATRPPAYLNDVLRQTARKAQRPRWTFLERWLPVDSAIPRPTIVGRLPFRQLVIVALLVALAAAALAFYVGSQKRLPAPFGPAANGDLLYSAAGDIYARDPITGRQRPVIVADGDQFAASYSPNGELITYATASAEGDHFMVANGDGTNPHQLALIPSTGNAQGAWAPDSRSVGFIYDVKGLPQLSLVSVNGQASVIALDDIVPLDIAFMPPNGGRLLIRARVAGSEKVGLYTMKLDGSDRQTIVEARQTTYGVQFTNSGAVFSPDGRTIAYNGLDVVSQADGKLELMFRIHLVNADGSNDRALPGPSDPTVNENWPVFSPDGTSILVLRFKTRGDVFGGEGWIASMPADGSRPARDVGVHFTDDKSDTAISKGWSPDGSRILIAVGSKQEVYSVDPSTGSSELLAWTKDLPDWQRIAFR